jgi:hypothetical protein
MRADSVLPVATALVLWALPVAAMDTPAEAVDQTKFLAQVQEKNKSFKVEKSSLSPVVDAITAYNSHPSFAGVIAIQQAVNGLKPTKLKEYGTAVGWLYDELTRVAGQLPHEKDALATLRSSNSSSKAALPSASPALAPLDFLNGHAWGGATKVERSIEGAAGAFTLTTPHGRVVLKFEDDDGAAIASQFLHEVLGIAAPQCVMLATTGEPAASIIAVVAKLRDTNDDAGHHFTFAELRKRPLLLLMNEVGGINFQLADQATFSNFAASPEFAGELGRLMVGDVFLGNHDRINVHPQNLKSVHANGQNLMLVVEHEKPGICAIDNELDLKTVGTRAGFFKALLNARKSGQLAFLLERLFLESNANSHVLALATDETYLGLVDGGIQSGLQALHNYCQDKKAQRPKSFEPICKALLQVL